MIWRDLFWVSLHCILIYVLVFQNYALGHLENSKYLLLLIARVVHAGKR